LGSSDSDSGGPLTRLTRSKDSEGPKRLFIQRSRVAGAHIVIEIVELAGAPQSIEHETVIRPEGMGLAIAERRR
jgi:hypothetical protein